MPGSLTRQDFTMQSICTSPVSMHSPEIGLLLFDWLECSIAGGIM
jgi:hypothetical protein